MKKLVKGLGINRKMLVMCAVVAIMVSSMSVFAFAAETDVQSVLTTSFQTMIDDILVTAGAILPICLGVMGFTVSVGFAVKWFKKLTGMGTTT